MLLLEGRKISEESRGGSGMGSRTEEVNSNFAGGGLSRIGNEILVWLVGIWNSSVESLVAYFNMELEQMDVKITILHGKLEEMVYMVQLKGFTLPGQEYLVCKLKKSLNGLKHPLLPPPPPP